MLDPFRSLVVSRKTGCEKFRNGPTPLPFDILSFWQWSASDLASNALRGRLAEFLVAQALGLGDGLRAEWDAHDLKTASGKTIEVKSAAYLQTWTQKTFSSISFGVSPTLGWDSATNVYATDTRRQADLYVFSLLQHQDKTTLDPLDVSQWLFFVLLTSVLNGRLGTQQSIGLARLRTLEPIECSFVQLKEAIEQVAKSQV